jgi:hypothetical protein
MDWQKDFNPEIGLWTSHKPGHTPETLNLASNHVVPQGACALLVAAQLGELSQVPVTQVLRAIRAKQSNERGTSRFGQVCFFYEESVNYDNNASFFAGLPLALLFAEYGDVLAAEDRRALEVILADMALWFSGKLGEDRAFYPNMYLGELSVAWIVGYAAGDEGTLGRVLPLIDGVIARYEADGWGWAEDMSDVYSKILCDQLSTLALLAKGLPANTRAGCLRLLNHLLGLEDFFRPGPRVPALRSYAFTESASHPSGRPGEAVRRFRESVRAWLPGEEIRFRHVAPLGHLLNERGWHEAVAAPAVERPDAITVRLHGGNNARARVFADARFGATDRFPVMPSAEHHEWGLSWQSMPVAYWQEAGDWGYFQWLVENAAGLVAHPSLFSKQDNLGSIQKSLSPDINPPMVGQTYTLWCDEGFLVLRRMPAIPSSWKVLSDRLRVVDLTAAAYLSTPQTLTIPYKERAIQITHVGPWHQCVPRLTDSTPGVLDFGPVIEAHALSKLRGYTALWAVTFDKVDLQEPMVTRLRSRDNIPRSASETAYTVEWVWPRHTWRVIVDPLAAQVLTSA